AGALRALQHRRRSRQSCAGFDESAGFLRMSEQDTGETRVSAPAATLAHARSTGSLPADEVTRLTDEIVTALKTVYDPEIPADIYELGLIYRVDIADDRKVTVDMTRTTPNCPSAAQFPAMVEYAVACVPGACEVAVSVFSDLPCDQSRMCDEARVSLNLW